MPEAAEAPGASANAARAGCAEHGVRPRSRTARLHTLNPHTVGAAGGQLYLWTASVTGLTPPAWPAGQTDAQTQRPAASGSDRLASTSSADTDGPACRPPSPPVRDPSPGRKAPVQVCVPRHVLRPDPEHDGACARAVTSSGPRQQWRPQNGDPGAPGPCLRPRRGAA